jgi:hypothetical protein
MLTTETVPTMIARAIGDVIVEDVKAARLGGTLTVQPKRLSTRGIAKEIDAIRRAHGALTVITNRAGDISNTITHASARGSNGMRARNLAQIVTCMHPARVDKLRVINRLFQMDKAVKTTHVDEIQQSAGRNLGFRWDGESDHTLVVDESVWAAIKDSEEWRYNIQVCANAVKRKNKKFNTERSSMSLNRGALSFDEWLAQEEQATQEVLVAEAPVEPGMEPIVEALIEVSGRDDHKIEFTLFDGLKPVEDVIRTLKTGTPEELTWVEWKEFLDEASDTDWGPTKAHAFAITAARFKCNRRLKEAVDYSTMVLFDYDDGTAMKEVESRLCALGARSSLWTTASHSPDAPRFRGAVHFAHRLTADEHRWAWFALRSLLQGSPDESKIGAESGFFVPGRYGNVDHPRHIEGKPLQLDRLRIHVDQALIDKLSEPKPLFTVVEEPAYVRRHREFMRTHTPRVEYDDSELVSTDSEVNPLLSQEALNSYFGTEDGGWHHARFRLMCSISNRSRKRSIPITAQTVYRLYMNLDGHRWYGTEADRQAVRRDADRALGISR